MPRAEQANRDSRHWIRHGYFRTYAIAGVLATLARDSLPYIRDLEAMTVDNGVLAFVEPMAEDHRGPQARAWVADRMFLEDTSGPVVELYPEGNPFTSEPVRRLPVDLALNAYGITDDAFEIPPRDDQSTDENACYDYFTESLGPSGAYERLLKHIGTRSFISCSGTRPY